MTKKRWFKMTTKAEILKTIRKHCLLCCYGSPNEVSLCTGTTGNKDEKCLLYPYRFGSDPNPNAKKVEQGKLHGKLHGFKSKK